MKINAKQTLMLLNVLRDTLTDKPSFVMDLEMRKDLYKRIMSQQNEELIKLNGSIDSLDLTIIKHPKE